MMRLSLAAAVIAAAIPTLAIAATVDVRVAGVRSGGFVLVQLCSETEGFRRCSRGVRLAAQPGTMIARFTNVPPGRYAAQTFQDTDSNGRMGFNMSGRPTEPWGYSRAARGVFGPPNFSDAEVAVPASGAVIPVTLGL